MGRRGRQPTAAGGQKCPRSVYPALWFALCPVLVGEGFRFGGVVFWIPNRNVDRDGHPPGVLAGIGRRGIDRRVVDLNVVQPERDVGVGLEAGDFMTCLGTGDFTLQHLQFRIVGPDVCGDGCPVGQISFGGVSLRIRQCRHFRHGEQLPELGRLRFLFLLQRL